MKEVSIHSFFSPLKGDVGTIAGSDEYFSQVLQKVYRVLIYYPPGYQENILKRYPVLYMHDGHNIFFPDHSYAGQTWETDATLETLNEMNLIDKVVIVAVYPRDRMFEYTQPGYELYGRFLTEELKPFVDHKIRTLLQPKDTAVMGSSLGGSSLFISHLAVSRCVWYGRLFIKHF